MKYRYRHLARCAVCGAAAIVALSACAGSEIDTHDMGDGVTCYELESAASNEGKALDCLATEPDEPEGAR